MSLEKDILIIILYQLIRHIISNGLDVLGYKYLCSILRWRMALAWLCVDHQYTCLALGEPPLGVSL